MAAQIVWQRLIVVNIVHVDTREGARATDVSAKVRAVPHTWNACTINASQVIQQPARPTHTNVPVNAFVRGTMTVPESGVRMPIPCVLRRKSIHGSVPVRPRVHSTATAPITTAPLAITRSVTPDPVDVDATVELTVTVLATTAVRQGNLLSAWRCPARMLACVSNVTTMQDVPTTAVDVISTRNVLKIFAPAIIIQSMGTGRRGEDGALVQILVEPELKLVSVPVTTHVRITVAPTVLEAVATPRPVMYPVLSMDSGRLGVDGLLVQHRVARGLRPDIELARTRRQPTGGKYAVQRVRRPRHAILNTAQLMARGHDGALGVPARPRVVQGFISDIVPATAPSRPMAGTIVEAPITSHKNVTWDHAQYTVVGQIGEVGALVALRVELEVYHDPDLAHTQRLLTVESRVPEVFEIHNRVF